MRPVAPDGRAFSVEVDSVAIEPATATSPIDIRARLRLTPPPGALVRRLRLNYSVINHEVMTHTVMVFAHGDWELGVLGQPGAHRERPGEARRAGEWRGTSRRR